MSRRRKNRPASRPAPDGGTPGSRSGMPNESPGAADRPRTAAEAHDGVRRGATSRPAVLRWPFVALVAVLLVIAIGVGMALRSRADRQPDALPPIASRPDEGPAFTDFAGAGACAECHADPYAEWRASTHGLAGGAPARERLLRAFDSTPIRFRDATVTPRANDGGTVAFVVAWEDRAPVTFTVEGVVGGGHMVGGGTQGFLTRFDDGTLRFLPFELIRSEDVWFCNTGTRLDRGWLPITDSMRLADCGDWPPIRVFGSIPRFGNCQECHGSQVDVARTADAPYRTRYQTLAIDCESCHGPGRKHADMMASDASRGADIAMAALEPLSKEASVDVCLRCHALKDGLRPGSQLPGGDFAGSWSVKLPFLSDAPVFADGRIRTFAYQQGHLWSDCWVNGSLTCTDCHDPHSQHYRDPNGRPLPGRFDDGQCTACHPSKIDRLTEHTKHAADSPGSRCVACHMPYLQAPEVGTAIRYARSDHTIPVPRPAADAALGIENACQTCHRDRDAATLDRETGQLWGELKPRPAAVDALLRYETGEAEALDRALAASPAETHGPAETIALGSLLRDRLRPDMPSLDRTITERLERAAVSTDPDIAALGLAALHYARGNTRDTRRFLLERAGSLDIFERAVRTRWKLLLAFMADRDRERGEFADAITGYRKALELDSTDAGVLLNLGIALAASGDGAAAEVTYTQSLRADSMNALTWVNLGIARAARGMDGPAIAAYQRAMRVDPFDALPWFNLGNIHLRANRFEDALAAYDSAATRSPGMAPAWFNLARAAIPLGRLEYARAALRNGLAFDSADQSARQALGGIDSLLARSGGR